MSGSAGTAFAATGPDKGVSPVANPAAAVNPFLATGDGGAGGQADDFPGPDVPFGMMQWGPDTTPDRPEGGGYYYNDSNISGFSLTHMSGPGCGAFGDVPILPTVGALPANPSSVSAPFSHDAESASSDYYSVTTGTGASAVKTELTETARSGIGRFTFPAGAQSNLLFKLTGSQNGDSATSAQVVGPNEIKGSVTSGHFCGASNTYTLNFDMVFDQPFTANGTWTGSTVTPGTAPAAAKTTQKANTQASPNTAPGSSPTASPSPNPTASPSPSASPSPAAGSSTGGSTPAAPKAKPGALPAPTLHGAIPAAPKAATQKLAANAAATGPDGLYLTFDTSSDQVVQAKVGISFTSGPNAQANLAAEQTGFAFDAVHAAGVKAWNAELGKIQIGGGTAARQQVFYTGLYHSLLHPNIFSDTNGQYVGFDNQVHTVQAGHIQVANYSGWDIYRSQAQLEAIVDPAMASNAAQSIVNDAAQNNGMMPKWAMNNGESYVMVGDPADGELADYYAFGAHDFDTASALKYALAEANTPNNIRPDLADFEKYGYVPSDAANTCCNFYGPVSTTEEYGAADFALSQFAGALGDKADATALQTRSQDWQNLFSPATGLLEPRTTNGQYLPTTLSSSDNYVEGDASQYRWQVGWNPSGLVTAMGGGQAVQKQLDTFFTQLDQGPPSPYAFLGNEPDMGVPWLYDYTGAPWKAQKIVNDVRTQIFTDDPKTSLGGNDDLGTTSAQGAFSMLGMFPEAAGSADMALNSPEFPLEIIHLANGKAITVNAPGADSVKNFYVQSMKLNGSSWHSAWLPAAAFTHGATLDVKMGSTPNKSWGAGKNDAPPSHTAGQQPAIGYLSDQQLRVTPGSSATVTVSAQDVAGDHQKISVGATPPAGSGLTVKQSSSTLHLSPAGHDSLKLTINAPATAAQTFYTVPVQLTADGKALPPLKLTVLVAPAGSLLASFDNNGIADDTQITVTNFDGSGNSYSAQALAGAGLTPGQPVTVGGITYTWPLPAPGNPDNVVAAGQKVNVSAAAGTQELGLLGSADGGPSQGVMTLNYSDGSTAQFWLGLSDWTLGAGKSKPSFGNGDAATLSYRDCSSCAGGKDTTATHVFSTVFPVDPAKTLTSVTLPNGTDQGRLHVFAVGTSTTAPTGAVTTSATPSPAAAGQQVTVHGSGFGATQGTGYVAFSDQGINWGAPGNSAAFTVDSWSDTAVTFTVPTPSGTNGMFHVYPGSNAAVTVVNAAGQVSDSQVLPMTPTANPADYFDNIGTSADSNQQCADFDGDGYSYSADALAAAGIKPGGTVTSDGVTYTWPNVQPCGADNILPAGQTMLVTGKAGATKLGLLGSSTNGGSAGPITLTYTDGTSTTQTLTFNDWASGGDTTDTAIATMPYRNSDSGSSQSITMYVFSTTVPLDTTKTLASVTFPNVASSVGSNTTAMHVFAVSEG
ncbi:GH92 family glycosyl hydrolase [Catenulispora acidiphila]|uniref:GH92 family glycosyl hydrolase n=1 Tax=Catenulispora acidiphila TaxID=304895 RepID=UPI00019DF3F0|nr:GH92 family glycosyl hydrolase [Catenulispora acidiphila]